VNSRNGIVIAGTMGRSRSIVCICHGRTIDLSLGTSILLYERDSGRDRISSSCAISESSRQIEETILTILYDIVDTAC
jgi:hypothetical protein